MWSSGVQGSSAVWGRANSRARKRPDFRRIRLLSNSSLTLGANFPKVREIDCTREELLERVAIDYMAQTCRFRPGSAEIVSAGKHAYSEKPFVLSLEDGLALRAEANKRGVLIGSAPDTFLGGAHQQARALIDAGEIGRIVSGTCHVMGFGMEHWHPNPDFFYKPGAGPVLDVGPYYITDLINLVGPVRRVTALSGRAREKREISSEARRGEFVAVETPTTIHAVMEFASGALITLGASWDVEAHDHRNIELYGTRASLFLPDPNFFGGELIAVRRDGLHQKVQTWDHPLGRPNWDRDDGPPYANYRGIGLADMMASIDERRPARCGIDLALHAVEVMTAILASGESGNAVTLTTTCERPSALGPDDAAALLA